MLALTPSLTTNCLPLQIAVARTTYSMVVDPCLNQRPRSLGLTARRRFVAFLCTVVGGPVDSDYRCKYNSTKTKKQLRTPQELFEDLVAIHLG